jgi:hypothetical protein
MPRRYFNDGQEILDTDLIKVSSAIERELFDRVLYEIVNRQTSFFFGDGFIVSNVNATTSKVKAGNGAFYDSAQVDPEPNYRRQYLAADTNVSHSAADPTNPRIDIICARPNRANTLSESRNFKDASSGAISVVSMVVETDYLSDLLVTAGTPAGSPAVPATPAGYVKLAEVTVSATSGIAGAGAYTDKRTRYKKPSSYQTVASITSNTTGDIDDEIIAANATGGVIQYTLPDAALCDGKIIRVVKTDSSGNAVTVGRTGTNLIIGATSQVLSTQYTMLSFVAISGAWYLI